MGLGYIGLPTAALATQKGFYVHGVDVNQNVINTINKGKIHIVEPSLEGLVHRAVIGKLLTANLEPTASDVFIIAVPTPLKENKQPELKYIDEAIQTLLPVLKPGNLLILESTSPVGTTEKLLETIIKARPDLQNCLHVAYCPERVLPGNILNELENNDRIIGGVDKDSTRAASDFYEQLTKGELLSTNARTAEMVKLAENAYRDVNIAFANELSMICSDENIDVAELIQLSNRHPRVNILNPGCGVGGHCIAIDPWFIVDLAPEKARLIKLAREINDYKPHWIVQLVTEKIENFRAAHHRIPNIALFGLTYKPDVDDIRESPALKIAVMMAEMNLPIKIVEPHLHELPKELQSFNNVQKVTTEDAMDADLGLMLVKHKAFKNVTGS
jgi:UDP-N-acetyl-D-mannosaminuronic acid dehydrogenase